MAIKIHSKDELIQILEDIKRGNLPSDYLVKADFSDADFLATDTESNVKANLDFMKTQTIPTFTEELIDQSRGDIS